MNRSPAIALRHAGFTLVELLIVFFIGAILAAIAVPSLRGTLLNTRQSSAFGLVISDLNLARGEAIKRNSRMLMCARNVAGTDCDANWQLGWVVCIEAAIADTCAPPTVAVPNPVVVIRPALDGNLTLVGSANAIRFNPNSSQGAGGANATLIVSGTWADAVARTATVAGTGNISR